MVSNIKTKLGGIDYRKKRKLPDAAGRPKAERTLHIGTEEGRENSRLTRLVSSQPSMLVDRFYSGNFGVFILSHNRACLLRAF
jgi:hypothetical protein